GQHARPGGGQVAGGGGPGLARPGGHGAGVDGPGHHRPRAGRDRAPRRGAVHGGGGARLPARQVEDRDPVHRAHLAHPREGRARGVRAVPSGLGRRPLDRDGSHGVLRAGLLLLVLPAHRGRRSGEGSRAVALSLGGLLAAYLICGVPGGLVGARLAGGVDIRRHGSGNIGATNVLRTLGPAAGVITLLGDVVKGSAAVWGAGTLGGAPAWVGPGGWAA